MKTARTDTETLVKALRILAEHTYTDDGVFNACIAEAADRLEQQAERIRRLEEAGDAMAKDFSHFWTDRESVRLWPKVKGSKQ